MDSTGHFIADKVNPPQKYCMYCKGRNVMRESDKEEDASEASGEVCYMHFEV